MPALVYEKKNFLNERMKKIPERSIGTEQEGRHGSDSCTKNDS